MNTTIANITTVIKFLESFKDNNKLYAIIHYLILRMHCVTR